MQKLSSQDRSVLIRFASSLPSGSPEKKAILAGLAKISAGMVGQIVTTILPLRNKGPGNDVSIPKGTQFRVLAERSGLLDVEPLNKSKFGDAYFFLSPNEVMVASAKKADLNKGDIDADIVKYGMQEIASTKGKDLVAVYLSLKTDMPIAKVARKMRAVVKALGAVTPAEAYNNNKALLNAAIKAAGLPSFA